MDAARGGATPQGGITTKVAPLLEQQLAGYQTFVQLERAARSAVDGDALRLTIVGETRRLLAYHRAVLLLADRRGRLRVVAISDLPVVERDAPMVRWLERLSTGLAAADWASLPRALAAPDVDEAEREAWAEWLPPETLWCPLRRPDGPLIGVLWLGRAQPWHEAELVLAERLTDAYAHAWQALAGGHRRPRLPGLRPLLQLGLASAALGALFLPLHLSVLAPAEIRPRAPDVAAAPINGVIADILVRPDQPVVAGQPLFRLDATDLRQQRAVAAQALEVARAQYRRQSQVGMVEQARNQELAVLEGQIALRAAELAHAEALLEQVTVRARSDGIAVFSDPADWQGRPVATGERVMLIAAPERAQLRILLPVADAMVLRQGAPVELFLDVDPLHPVPARVTRTSYEAEPTPAGGLAYAITAAFAPGQPVRRIGLRGTAKISGERVSLFFYLFRRPLAWLRQALGV